MLCRNLDKRYLAALADAGVATVPTTWLTPGEPEIPLPPGQFVVKPTVSGGGFETAQYRTGDRPAAAARDHIRRLDAGRTAVDTQGEAGPPRPGRGRAARRSDDLRPAVLELELLDPALFFETHPAGAARFARVQRDMIP